MESPYQRRNNTKDPSRTDSNRFLAYSRLRPRPSSNSRNSENPPRSTAVDARLATVYDKMKSKDHIVLTNYSEELNPNLRKSNAWKETVKEIDRDSQRVSNKTPGFSQLSELLSLFQIEIFDILKSAKRLEEIHIKSKLWEVFNSLSNSLWTNFFRNRVEDKDLVQENIKLKNTLDRMEEQILTLKAQMQDKNIETPSPEISTLKFELKRIKELNRELSIDLNEKIAIIQSKEKQLSILKHDPYKDYEYERRSSDRSENLKDALMKVTQERDSLRDWKNRFTQYPSTYEKAIQRIKEEHGQEKTRLQENINKLQSIINDSPSKTSNFGFSRTDQFAKQDSRGFDTESRLRETISILKKENTDLKQQQDMIITDYEEICGKLQIQSEQFERMKEEHSKTLEYLQSNSKDIQDFDYNEDTDIKKPKPGGIEKSKKNKIRSGKPDKQSDKLILEDIQTLDQEKKILELQKTELEDIIKNDEKRINELLSKIEEIKKILEQREKEFKSNIDQEVKKYENLQNDFERTDKDYRKKIETLEQNIKALNSRISSSQDEKNLIKDLEAVLKERNETIASLSQAVQSLRTQKDQLERDTDYTLKISIQEKDIEIEELKKMLEDKDNAIDSLIQENDLEKENVFKLKKNINEKDAEIHNLNQTLPDLKGPSEESQKIIESLQQVINENSEKLNKTASELKEKDKIISSLNAQKTQSEAQISDHFNQIIQKKNNEIQSLTQQLEKASKEKENFINLSQSKFEFLKQDKIAAENAIKSELQGVINQKSSKITKLNQELEELKVSYNNTKNHYEQKYSDLELMMEEREETISKLEESRMLLDKDISNLNQNNSELLNHIQELEKQKKEEINKLHVAMSARSKEIEILASKNENLINEISDLKISLMEKDSEIQQKLGTKSEILANLEVQLQETKANYEKLTKIYQKQSETVIDLEDQIQTNKSEYEYLSEQYQKQSEALETLQNQLNKNKNEYETLYEEYQTHSETIAVLEDQLQKSQEMYAKQSETIIDLEKQLQKFINDYENLSETYQNQLETLKALELHLKTSESDYGILSNTYETQSETLKNLENQLQSLQTCYGNLERSHQKQLKTTLSLEIQLQNAKSDYQSSLKAQEKEFERAKFLEKVYLEREDNLKASLKIQESENLTLQQEIDNNIQEKIQFQAIIQKLREEAINSGDKQKIIDLENTINSLHNEISSKDKE